MAAAPTGFHPTPRFRISGRYCNRPTTMHKVRQQNRLFGECHHQAVSHNHPSIHSFYCFQAAKSSSCQFLRHCRKNLKCLQNSGYRVLMVSGKNCSQYIWLSNSGADISCFEETVCKIHIFLQNRQNGDFGDCET